MTKASASFSKPASVWHRANGILAKDRYGRFVGIISGVVALVGLYIESGYEAAMIAAVTFAGLGIQIRMFLALLNVTEQAIRGKLNRKELVVGLALLVLAIAIQTITKVPLTVTTAFSAAFALSLFVVIKIIARRR